MGDKVFWLLIGTLFGLWLRHVVDEVVLWWPRRRCSLRVGEYGPRCTRWAVEYCKRCRQSRCSEHQSIGFFDTVNCLHGKRANRGQKPPPVATA